MLDPTDIQAFIVTLKLAMTTTLILLLMGTPLAWWLARTDSRMRSIIEALIALPLVLHPTVLGFILRVGTRLRNLLSALRGAATAK